MNDLPLVLDQTARWCFFYGTLAAVIFYIVGADFVKARRWKSSLPLAYVATVGPLLAFFTWTTLLPLGWQLRVDGQGVTLHAPMEFWADRGTIAWGDLREVRIGSTWGTRSGSFPTLEFVGSDGTVLVLKALNAVPSAYWPALAAAIEANGPSVALQPDRARGLEELRGLTLSDPSDRAMVGYVGRDGRGRRLE